MIFDHINNLDSYSEMKEIYTALKFLSSLEKVNFPKERISIDGERIFANPVTLFSKPLENCVFEAHQRYIDIHYIISGIEGISTSMTSDLTPIGTFNRETDIGFYNGEPSGTYYLRPGEFMVCWPQDAHRVGMMSDRPEQIRKIVVKVTVKEA